MIYTLEQIKELAEPIAKKYQLNALWVFGSYARGEATDESDVDFLMDYTGSTIFSFYDFIDISDEFEEKFNKKIDLISTETLNAPTTKQNRSKFINFISKEKVIIYEK
jgi:predicted nucleotidyltransferase